MTASRNLGALLIRPAHCGDEGALEQLAALDSARPLDGGDVLVAEQDGELVAAYAPASGRSIADPFVASAPLVTLLHERAHGSTRRVLRMPLTQRPHFSQR